MQPEEDFQSQGELVGLFGQRLGRADQVSDLILGGLQLRAIGLRSSLPGPVLGLEFIQKWIQTVPGNRKVVTINLREAPYWNARNSNLEAWAKFARSLDPSLYYPVFIRDTYSALDPVPPELEGLNLFPEIPWHIDLRAALYEKSYLNLFVNNGPAILCTLNKKTRYIVFKYLMQECASTNESFIKKFQGLNFGDQWPGATPFQRLVWEADDYERIQEEFNSLCEKMDSSNGNFIRCLEKSAR